MELNLISLHDVPSTASAGERRRRIRHKPHTPIYASFTHPPQGLTVNLSELLDLHEDGFAVQASDRMQVNQNVNFSLDLPETQAIIPCSGQVVWTDGAGRAGIRFSSLHEHSRKQLKEWLFINLLIASSNRVARMKPADQPLQDKEKKSERAERKVEVSSPVPTPVPDLTGMLSAIEAVRREVKATGDDLDAAFRLVADRALSLTGASGAAVAFLTNDNMVCRARAGEPAPPVGAVVDAKRGLSGECVRSGRMMKCDDSETDPRVDREICRVLGIGSVLAAPILSDFRVVGLIEVFSPRARAFTEVHETALDRLVEIVPKGKTEPAPASERPMKAVLGFPADTDASANSIREALWEPESEAEEPLKGLPIRRLHLVLLLLAAAAVFMALGYLLAPTIEKWWSGRSRASDPPVVSAASTATAAESPRTIEEVRKLAEQGDANAQWTMGVRYHHGDGVLADDAQAVQWFLRAAEQGHVASQASLGAYYWAGRGVPEDLSKAFFWSVLAMAQGDESSKARVEGLTARMPRPQVLAARQQAEEWLRQHHTQMQGK